MTDEERKAIRERVNKATVGPWVAECLGSEGYTIKADFHGDLAEAYALLGFRGNIGEVRGGRDWQELRSNAEFIAAARMDVLELLDEVEHLRNESKAWQEAVRIADETITDLRRSLVFGGDAS